MTKTTGMPHPLQTLRKRLARDFCSKLPKGVLPVAPWCGEPQFFPGGSGLPTQATWGDLSPGTLPAISFGLDALPAGLPEVSRRDVMVVAHFQSTVSQYSRVVAGLSAFEVTWRELRYLLSGVEPCRTFLTNVHIGLLDASSVTATFPTTPSYRERCAELLELEIALFRPRIVVCLGAPAARLLAEVVSGSVGWKPWPGYSELAAKDAQKIEAGLGEIRFAALALRHPSAVVSRVERRREADLVELAVSG